MTNPPPPVIAMVAGELSGDNLGAPLMAAIRQQHPNARFVGIGGPEMINQGLEVWFDMDRLNVNGFVDPIKRLPDLLNILLTVRRKVLDLKPDCFIGVDFNFFNLLLEGTLKRNGIKTVHYVSPTVWAWRSGRIHRIARSVDLMLCLYPFETDIYNKVGVGVRFVGHPKAFEIAPDEGVNGKSEARTGLGLPALTPVVAILPGSRGSEVGYSGPDFLDAARLVQKAKADCLFVIPAANQKRMDQITAMLVEYSDLSVTVVLGNSREVMTASDVVLVNSGTATLEAMLLRRPMVMSYRLGNLTYALVSRMVKTDYFALPNVLAGKALVPELLQHDATPEALSQAVLLLFTEDHRDRLLAEFDRLHQELRIDAGSEAASAVLELCEAHRVVA